MKEYAGEVDNEKFREEWERIRIEVERTLRILADMHNRYRADMMCPDCMKKNTIQVNGRLVCLNCNKEIKWK
jgi:hypothetical protein